MIITFDVDGVIAEMAMCDHDPALRNARTYYAKRPHANLDLRVLNEIIANHVVYFVSARSFKGASTFTRRWLERVGVNVDDALGVICAENGDCGQMSKHKHQIIEYLGADLHIDDHPLVIRALPAWRGILYYNPDYPDNISAMSQGEREGFYTAYNWKDISKIIQLPHEIE